MTVGASASVSDDADRGPEWLIPVDESERMAAVRRYGILDTPPDGAFDRICALAARVFDVPIATVTIVDERRIWFKACHGITVTEIPRDPGLCASAILHDVPYVVSDAATDPRTLNNPLVRGELGLRFYAAAPISTANGHRLGTVNVIDTKPRQVTEEELLTLRDLAALVSDELELRLAALDVVRVQQQARDRIGAEMQRVARVAQTLQQSLLPSRLPTVPGLDAATFYQPLSRDEVGGDFYDMFPLGGDRWGAFVGDVCGKGVRAAALTSLVRYSLRAAAAIEPGPAEVLADLNTAVLLDPERDDLSYCTVVYAQLVPTPGGAWKITLASGGHPPALVIRRGGTVDRIVTKGTLLGCFDDVDFTAVTFELAPGDTLLLYTDGLTDTRLRGAWLGVDGLADLLTGQAVDATALVTQIQRLTGMTDEPLRDDIAVLALTVRDPEPAHRP